MNCFKAWFLASRPKTLTGAAAPVLVGAALAWEDCFSRAYLDLMHNMLHPYSAKVFASFWLPLALCLLFAFLMQIDANLVNDYFDFKKGTDREDRLGPERACAQGWITPGAMRIGIGIVTILACLVGCLIMLWHLQYELLLVGIACVIGCFIYTTKFSYLGLGDILVLVFFGIVPVGFTYYVISEGQWSWALTLAGLGMGLATDNLLIVNNYRDRHQDAISGKKTIIVRWGAEFGRRIYLWLGIIATVLAMTVLFIIDKPYLFMLIYLVLHIATWFKMCRLEGKALNGILGKTARNIFLYGLLLAGAMVVVTF